jgi:hypothetical protein
VEEKSWISTVMIYSSGRCVYCCRFYKIFSLKVYRSIAVFTKDIEKI